MFKREEDFDTRYIALYCRVSTEEQAREGLSLDEQKHRLESYCHALGFKQEVRIFIDDGYSAKNLERPKLNLLLEELKANKISKIIVTKLDRISRKLLNLLELIDLFQNHDVTFISISESFDTNTPSGRLTLQVLGAVAEFERERIRERVVDNMFHAANQGQWLTSAPYGYNLVDKKLMIDDKHAEVVKEVFSMYLEKSMGFLTIAKILNNRGIPSPTGKEWWNRTIKLVLQNPAYKGFTVWNRREGSNKNRPEKDESEWIIQENTHPPIITPEVWDKVNERLQQRSLPSRSQSSPNLLSGLLKCGNCGSGMSVSPSGSRVNPYKVYRCSAYKNKGTCTGKQYKLEETEKWFKQGLKQLSKQLSVEMVPKVYEKQSSDITFSNSHQRLHTAKKRYQRKVEAYTIGLVTLEELQEEKNKLEQVEAESKVVQKKAIDPEVVQQELQMKIKTVFHAMESLEVSQIKPLLTQIFDKIILHSDEEMEIVLRGAK